MWSYGDSNSGPLACHTHSAHRPAWLGVTLRGVHLRLPWLHVARRRLVPLHVGSPLGFPSSLEPLMFEDPAIRPRRNCRHRLAVSGSDRSSYRERNGARNRRPRHEGITSRIVTPHLSDHDVVPDPAGIPAPGLRPSCPRRGSCPGGVGAGLLRGSYSSPMSARLWRSSVISGSPSGKMRSRRSTVSRSSARASP
jgi:hypothetical protein